MSNFTTERFKPIAPTRTRRNDWPKPPDLLIGGAGGARYYAL
jgi:hypothetical protein